MRSHRWDALNRRLLVHSKVVVTNHGVSFHWPNSTALFLVFIFCSTMHSPGWDSIVQEMVDLIMFHCAKIFIIISCTQASHFTYNRRL